MGVGGGLVSWCCFCRLCLVLTTCEFIFARFDYYCSCSMFSAKQSPSCIKYSSRSVPKRYSQNSLRKPVRGFPEDSYTPPPSQLSIYLPMNSLTSQTQSRSSHPVLATHPSLPNRHQSTPHTNSVCRPILPNSLPCSPPKPSDPA